VPDSILARIDGTAVKTALPTVAVVAGTINTTQSSVSVAAGTVSAGDSVLVTLTGRDAAGRSLVTGDRPATIEFVQSGGGTGLYGAVRNADDGSYSAFFVGQEAGGPTTISATINGVSVGTPAPTIVVVAGSASPATSVLGTSADSLGVNDTATLTLSVFDAFGNPVVDPGLNVALVASDSTLATIGAAGYLSGNQYTAVLTAVATGSVTVGATLEGIAASTPPVTIRID
jgi:hypothetical protein